MCNCSHDKNSLSQFICFQLLLCIMLFLLINFNHPLLTPSSDQTSLVWGISGITSPLCPKWFTLFPKSIGKGCVVTLNQISIPTSNDHIFSPFSKYCLKFAPKTAFYVRNVQWPWPKFFLVKQYDHSRSLWNPVLYHN